MTAWFGTPFYKNQVALLKDVPAESIIKSPIDNMELFVDQVDAGNMILRINWLSQGLIAYQFVSLIDNMLESRGAYRGITSYFVTDGAPETTATETSEQTATVIDKAIEYGPERARQEDDKEEDGEVVTAFNLTHEEDELLPDTGMDNVDTGNDNVGETTAAGAANDTTLGVPPYVDRDGDVCPYTGKIRALLTKKTKIIQGAKAGASYNKILNTVLPDREEGCTYKNIEYDYIALKGMFDEGVKNDFKVDKTTIDEVTKNIDEMLVKLYQNENDTGPLHNLAKSENFTGGKKKNGSKKKKNSKKKGRKTKRKMYTKKKKGNSKKHKKKPKVKRNTRRK